MGDKNKIIFYPLINIVFQPGIALFTNEIKKGIWIKILRSIIFMVYYFFLQSTLMNFMLNF